MFNYLSRLRREPPEQRHKKILIVSSLITVLIVLVWIVALGHKIDRFMEERQTESIVAKPLGQLSGSIKSGFVELVQNVSELKERMFSGDFFIENTGSSTDSEF
ncbi:MAG: hypothetical protein Q8P52_02800 [bacterium]|nr:hypothetical protein [bacterium]